MGKAIGACCFFYVIGAAIAFFVLFTVDATKKPRRDQVGRFALWGAVVLWPLTLALFVAASVCAAAFMTPRLFVWSKQQVGKTVEEAAKDD